MKKIKRKYTTALIVVKKLKTMTNCPMEERYGFVAAMNVVKSIETLAGKLNLMQEKGQTKIITVDITKSQTQ